MSRRLLLSLCLLLAAWLSPALAGDDLKVVVTVKPVHALLAGLMNGIGEPLLLIDGEQSPFDYRPDARARQALESADLVVWVGPELEHSLQPLIRSLPKRVKAVELLADEDLKILPSRTRPKQRNPFFWMDDRNAIILLDELTEALIAVDPERAHVYARNRRRLLKPLKRIDREYEYGYRGLQVGTVAEFYDSLYYFEQAYALPVVGHVATTPLDGIDTARVLALRSRMLEYKTRCLLLDRGMPAKELELLTTGLKLRTAEIDPLGLQFPAGEDLYLKLMRQATDVIKGCLQADMDEAARARARADADFIPATERIGGRFLLTDQFGRLVSEEDLKGHWSLIYFGYTHCPDVCPTSLSTMTQALKRLGPRAKRIQPYFVTVDPERDTAPVMREYVQYFDPRLIGLTGPPEMVHRLAEQFGVRFEKGEADPEHPDQYAMDHSASLFLMAPDGRFVTKFAYGISAQTLADKLAEYIR